MDVNWRMRIMIFTVMALMLFGDFFGYGSIVRGVNSNPNQAAAAAAAVAQGPPVVGAGAHPSSSGVVQAASSGGPATSTGSGKYQHKDAEIEINAEDADLDEISAAALKNRRHLAKTQLSDTIKESCLPKMLCEMASKPDYMLTEKERDLLHLIRASTLSLAMNGTPSKWHFAAHMGELLRYTGDSMSGPMGCANLWPSCPISSKKLMKLSYKVKI